MLRRFWFAYERKDSNVSLQIILKINTFLAEIFTVISLFRYSFFFFYIDKEHATINIYYLLFFSFFIKLYYLNIVMACFSNFFFKLYYLNTYSHGVFFQFFIKLYYLNIVMTCSLRGKSPKKSYFLNGRAIKRG